MSVNWEKVANIVFNRSLTPAWRRWDLSRGEGVVFEGH